MPSEHRAEMHRNREAVSHESVHGIQTRQSTHQGGASEPDAGHGVLLGVRTERGRGGLRWGLCATACLNTLARHRAFGGSSRTRPRDHPSRVHGRRRKPFGRPPGHFVESARPLGAAARLARRPRHVRIILFPHSIARVHQPLRVSCGTGLERYYT